MNSTPTPKETEPQDPPAARADERLVHAHEQIMRADEQLARLSEQLAKIERDAARPPCGRTWPAITAWMAGVPGPRRFAAGGVHHCRRPGLAVVFWRRGQAGRRPFGAAARFNAIIAAGKSAAPCTARFIWRSSGRGGGCTTASNTTASNTLGSDHNARRRADSYRSASRSHTVAANDGAQSREHGAKHRTAQGEPATNSQRQFKGDRGTQGEPGRDKTRAREGFGAEPASRHHRPRHYRPRHHRLRRSQLRPCASLSRLRPCASLSGRVSRRKRESGLDT